MESFKVLSLSIQIFPFSVSHFWKECYQKFSKLNPFADFFDQKFENEVITDPF